MTVTLNKWGNSLGIRIPKHIVEQANLAAGKELIISMNKKGQLVLEAKEENLTLDDLIEGVTPQNRHDLHLSDEIGKEKWKY